MRKDKPFLVILTLSLLLLCYKGVKNCIWLFEQEQALGFSSVSTNIRMTVIKLKSGGLWVHAPIAPTKECIQVLALSNSLPWPARNHFAPFSPVRDRDPRVCLDWFSSHALVKSSHFSLLAQSTKVGNMPSSHRNA